jgi:hypothetical protein
MRKGLKRHKIHLRLALACEGGGGDANGVERPQTTSVSLLHAREVEAGSKPLKIHLRVAVACEGGGGSANGVETK